MISKVRLLTIIFLSTVTAVVLSGCNESSTEAKESKAVVTIPVIAQPVTIADINAAYETTASLEAAAESSVTARAPGIVTEILVEEGDYVEAGQILAQLETDKLKLELKRASANLNQLANELKRNNKIFAKGLISPEAYDRVKYLYEAQQAATDLAKLNLDYATIRAPISGIIATRYIKEGNLLQQNATAFHITDLSEIYAIIYLPESEKAALAVGQLANVLVEASEYPFQGNIERISPVVDKDSGTIRVTISLTDKTGVLRPGMFSRVSVIYDTHQQAMLVPKDSILSQDNESSVYVVIKGIAYKRIVSTGFSDADFVEIIDGIDEDDLVITRGQKSLKNAANVELINTVAQL